MNLNSNRFLWGAALLFSFSHSEIPPADAGKGPESPVQFMPEYHLFTDGIFFFNAKNEAYRTKYFLETNTEGEFFLLGWKQALAGLKVHIRTLMGKQDDAIIFDPRDLKYGFVPQFEIRFKHFDFLSGVDHFCVHAIDRPVENSLYWNRWFLEYRHKKFRGKPFLSELRKNNNWKTRWTYTLNLGYYVRDGFGLFNPEVINAGQEYFVELAPTGAWGIFNWGPWGFVLRANPFWNFGRNGKFHQAYLLGLEAHLLKGREGFAVFFRKYFLDELPVWNKDKLLEIGALGYF